MHDAGENGRAITMRTEPARLGTRTPAPARAMPADYSISVRAKRAADRLITDPGDGDRAQPMRGYEDTFTDIVDYILRVTHRVWEEKAIGSLYEHYAANARVFQDDGIVYGRERVIADTTQTIGAFPDLRLHADDIVWCGDEDTGFWTSHRLTLVGHNTGWSVWGPPTGRRIVLGVIAECYSRENVIREEFVIYNTAGLLRQLGHDPLALARVVDPAAAARVADPGASPSAAPLGGVPPTTVEEGPALAGPEPAVPARAAEVEFPAPRHVGEVERVIGQGAPERLPADEPGIEALVRRILHEVWNWRLLDRVATHYAPGFRFHGPTDRELCGRGDYVAHLLTTLAMFPDAAHRVDDLYWMGNEREGYTVAVRWTLDGTHRGHGPYGPPTGRRVRQWGLSHLLVRDGMIVEEWTYSNEFDVLRQIHGDEPA